MRARAMAIPITIHFDTCIHFVDRDIWRFINYLCYSFREAGLVVRAGGRMRGRAVVLVVVG